MRRLWPSTEFWITMEEGYKWNPELILELDVDRLKELASDNCEIDIVEGLEAWTRLYTKDFLSNCTSNYWAEYTRFNHQSQYFSAMKRYYDELERQGMYEKMEYLACHSMEVDKNEEISHLWLIRSYMNQHKHHVAIEAYQQALEVLYDGDKTQASDQLQELGNYIRSKCGNGKPGLDAIFSEMPKERVGHALLCNITTFQKICTVQRRFIRRYGGQYSVVLMNWQEKDGAILDQQQKAYLSSELETVLCSCIRSGDVITHYSDRQFLILLFDATQAGAQIVIERILGRIERKAALRRRIVITSEIKELSEAEEPGEAKELGEETD